MNFRPSWLKVFLINLFLTVCGIGFVMLVPYFAEWNIHKLNLRQVVVTVLIVRFMSSLIWLKPLVVLTDQQMKLFYREGSKKNRILELAEIEISYRKRWFVSTIICERNGDKKGARFSSWCFSKKDLLRLKERFSL